ncbi:MAG: PD-(D/E)XK nuclease family protein [Acidobacteria bacterium]|nr:PD-(D/E)XK nuclease family protein [Acidobacteriota bacterium]
MGTPAHRPTPVNVFSFSRLKAFSQCPLRYKYRYIDGLSEAFRSIESYLGNIVHEVLEWMYARRDTGESPTLDAILDELARRWQASWSEEIAVIRVGNDPQDSYRSGREMLTTFYHRVFIHDRSTTVALEQRLHARLADGIAFTGFADRIGRTANGQLFVVDYKTSSREGDAGDFSEGLQAPLYAASAMDRHGDATCLAGYHYLRFGTTNWRPVTRQQGAGIRARFTELARQALLATEFPARPGVLCAWCGFNRTCPAAQVPGHLGGGLNPPPGGTAPALW